MFLTHNICMIIFVCTYYFTQSELSNKSCLLFRRKDWKRLLWLLSNKSGSASFDNKKGGFCVFPAFQLQLKLESHSRIPKEDFKLINIEIFQFSAITHIDSKRLMWEVGTLKTSSRLLPHVHGSSAF